MDSNQNDYHISFFKPTTAMAKWNRNLAIKLILIWAVAVFGFHFLLRAIEKPTPEEAYVKYEKVWENVYVEIASVEEMQAFAHSSLSVLGKVFIKPNEKASLNNAVSWVTYQLADSTQKELLIKKTKEFEKIKGEITSISDPKYIETKNALSDLGSLILGLEKIDPRRLILSNELVSSEMNQFKTESKDVIPAIMSTYLIHNQSFLTDFKFLGFPFHYFYSAVFLLVLFVFLCWLYCVRVDAMNIKLDIDE
jgi:putative solute:sodium symporter small subunit